jgi:hypothetical protein
VSVAPVVRPRLLLVSGALVAVSLSLPWAQSRLPSMPTLMYASAGPGGLYGVSGIWFGADLSDPTTVTMPGTQQPIRIVAALAVVLIWLGVRRASQRLARAGLTAAVLGLLIGMDGAVLSGHLVYALALALATVGLGVLPARLARGRSPDRSPGCYAPAVPYSGPRSRRRAAP